MGQRRSGGVLIPDITHGVDGYSRRHYLCHTCGEVFGMVDPETINHERCKVEEKRTQEPKSIKKCCGQFRNGSKCEICGNVNNSVCPVPDCDCGKSVCCQKKVNYYIQKIQQPGG